MIFYESPFINLAARRDHLNRRYWVPIVLLPVIRLITDKVLLPTVKLSHEISGQEKPNVGAAYIEAVSYIAAALVIYWCV